MRIKSYFAESVAVAMQMARAELGGDAMLLDSRPSPEESRHLGAYEVVFALDARSPASHARKLQEPLIPGEIQRLRQEVERMNEYVVHLGKQILGISPDGGPAGDPWSAWRHHLVKQEFSTGLIDRIMESLAGNQLAVDRIPDAIWGHAARLIPFADAEFLHRSSDGCGSGIVLVGPPGAGKTTTLVKLIFECGFKRQRPVQVFSLDSLRIAATEQLRAYCAVVGAGCRTLESARHLGLALSEVGRKTLVLIDTPGISPREEDFLAEMAESIRGNLHLAVILVLSANMKAADLQNAIERFRETEPRALIATHADNTVSVGGILSAAAVNRLPIVYFGCGQAIPEDLVPAGAEYVESLLHSQYLSGQPGGAGSRTPVNPVAAGEPRITAFTSSNQEGNGSCTATRQAQTYKAKSGSA